jgi:hypothetical protein
LIGVLDAFWGNKGYVTPAEFRQFCAPMVPLARFYGYLFKASEPFDVKVEVAHFGPSALENEKPSWAIEDLAGKVVAQGELPAREIPIGKGTALGSVIVDLSKLAAPGEYKLVVKIAALGGSDAGQGTIENSWKFWVYPATVDEKVPEGITLTRDWSEAQAKLAEGGKVLYAPHAAAMDDTCPPLNNVPVFWNRLMNPKLEAMLGLVCDVKHPALAGFPTEENCDWQWTELVRGVRAVNLDHAPAQLRPIVQAIDDWSRNYKLGVIFECKVGTGRLLVCTVDIDRDFVGWPNALQLRKSLLDYMAGERFQPAVELTPAQATALWPGSTGHGYKAGPQGVPPPDIEEGPTGSQPKRQ